MCSCVGQSEDVFYYQRVDFMKNVTADGEDNMDVLFIFSVHYLPTYAQHRHNIQPACYVAGCMLCICVCDVHAVEPAYIGHHIRQPTALVMHCVLPVKCGVSPTLCQRACEVTAAQLLHEVKLRLQQTTVDYVYTQYNVMYSGFLHFRFLYS